MVKNLPARQETWVWSLVWDKVPWRRGWQPTPVFLPGKSHGQGRLAGYSKWGCKRVRHDCGTTCLLSLTFVAQTVVCQSPVGPVTGSWPRQSSERLEEHLQGGAAIPMVEFKVTAVYSGRPGGRQSFRGHSGFGAAHPDPRLQTMVNQTPKTEDIPVDCFSDLPGLEAVSVSSMYLES